MRQFNAISSLRPVLRVIIRIRPVPARAGPGLADQPPVVRKQIVEMSAEARLAIVQGSVMPGGFHSTAGCRRDGRRVVKSCFPRRLRAPPASAATCKSRGDRPPPCVNDTPRNGPAPVPPSWPGRPSNRSKSAFENALENKDFGHDDALDKAQKL